MILKTCATPYNLNIVGMNPIIKINIIKIAIATVILSLVFFFISNTLLIDFSL